MKVNRLLLLTGLLLVAAGVLAADNPSAVSIVVKDKTAIEFRHGKELSGRYLIGPDVAKPYMWPLNAPNGKPVTRAWPMEAATPGEKTDHKHQKSLWFCHGDVIPEGVEIKSKSKAAKGVDFWDEDTNHGRIVCVKVETPEVKNNHGKVVTRNEWVSPDNLKVLDETRTIHFLDFGAAQLFVFDIDLNASNVPVTFGDTKEGSFGVRVAPSINEEQGKGHLTNADGHTGEGAKNNAKEDGCWGVKSAWCDYSGPVDGTTVGVTIFADPANPVATCWHSRGYGLMAANPFGRDKAGFPAMKGKTDLVKLAKGEHLKLRYGVLLHDGDVKEGKVAEYYKRFVDWKE
jgi:Methane oxygenase PmoA